MKKEEQITENEQLRQTPVSGSAFAKFYSIADILDCLPQNRPLYKDSGLWQVRTDNMEDVYIDQNHNETFRDFILRYIDLLFEFDKEQYDHFNAEIIFKERTS